MVAKNAISPCTFAHRLRRARLAENAMMVILYICLKRMMKAARHQMQCSERSTPLDRMIASHLMARRPPPPNAAHGFFIYNDKHNFAPLFGAHAGAPPRAFRRMMGAAADNADTRRMSATLIFSTAGNIYFIAMPRRRDPMTELSRRRLLDRHFAPTKSAVKRRTPFSFSSLYSMRQDFLAARRRCQQRKCLTENIAVC